jgi:hypothetical protein
MFDAALMDMTERRVWLEKFRHAQELAGHTLSASALAFGVQRLDYEIQEYIVGGTGGR